MERELRLIPHHGVVGQLLNSVFSLAGCCAFHAEYRLTLEYFNRYLKEGKNGILVRNGRGLEVRRAKEKLGW